MDERELALLKALGFDDDPFAVTNADQEQELRLREYFVPPPYFSSIQGDPDNPRSTVILAPRGGGKSTQRRMLEAYAEDNRIFSVTYDAFFLRSSLTNLDDVNTDFHVRNICFISLLKLINSIGVDQDLKAAFSELPRADREYLLGLVYHYFDGLQPAQIRNAAAAMFGWRDHLRNLWNTLTSGPAGSLLTFVARAMKVSLDLLPAPLPSVQDNPRVQLNNLFAILRRVGFRSILVLIDKVDETELTGNNPTDAYKLIKPLIRDLTFMNSNEFAVKFFLWDAMEDSYRRDARPDRVPDFVLRWRYDELSKMLQKRLYTYSSGRVASVGSIFSPRDDVDYETIIIAFSNYSPRNVLRILQYAVAEHARKQGKPPLSLESLDRGIRNFCSNYALETYDRAIVSDLQRVSRLGFVSSSLSNDLFRSPQTANRRIQMWQSKGVIKRVWYVPNRNRRGRPSPYYLVQDNALIPLVMQGTPVQDLVHEHLIHCPNASCGRVVFLELGDFTEDSPQCPTCETPLF